MSDSRDRLAAALDAGGRILVTRLLYLGDVILTLPLLDAIRERYPRAEIDYLCKSPAADLLSGDPRLKNVFVLREGQGIGSSLKLVSKLRSRHYDAVVDLYSNPRSAWLSFFSGARVRVGGNRRGRRHLYTHNITVPVQTRSAIEFHLQYLRPLGITAGPTRPVIVPGPEDKKEARALLKSHGVRLGSNPQEEKNAEPIIGIHPGGKWEVKRWPAGHFAGLIDKIKKKQSSQVVLLTGPGEAAPTERLVEICRDEVVRLPPLPIRTVAAVLSEFDAAVACDGGVMHLSVAVGTPTVGIFGSSEPEIWFPYEPFGPFAAALVPLDCRPCHQHLCPLGHTDCLNKLLPDLVLEKLTLVMEEQEYDHG